MKVIDTIYSLKEYAKSSLTYKNSKISTNKWTIGKFLKSSKILTNKKKMKQVNNTCAETVTLLRLVAEIQESVEQAVVSLAAQTLECAESSDRDESLARLHNVLWPSPQIILSWLLEASPSIPLPPMVFRIPNVLLKRFFKIVFNNRLYK